MRPTRYEWCEMCEVNTPICGNCNNNLCNGGHGIEKDGSPCKQCPKVYEEWMNKISKETGETK